MSNSISRFNRLNRSSTAALLAVLALTAPAAFAQSDKPADKPAEKPSDSAKPADDGTDPTLKRDTAHYNLPKDGKPAIEGYDPVAYFPEGGGAPKKGDKQFSFVYRGVTYWFASAENLSVFKKSPKKYEPAYGGWCAYAMGASGEKVEIDPKSFKITDGRLYLFYKDFFNDTRATWTKEEAKLQPKADKSWKKTSGEDPPAAAPAKPGK